MTEKQRRLRISAFLLCMALMLFALAGCGRDRQSSPVIKDKKLMHEQEFGGVYVDSTIEDFNKLGFKYGDSVSVSFSNGFELKDIPYYNGYYTRNGVPLLVAYPGYPYIKVCINNGDDLWKIAGLDENCTAQISLSQSGKYKDVQDARDISYKDERSEFPSDEVFANFRNVTAGNIRPGRFYRSASPCDNQHKRAPYVDRLMQAAGVQFILDLADTPAKIEGYISSPDFDSPYFLSLYRKGMVGLPLTEYLLTAGVEPIALNMNYSSPEFREKVAKGLASMAESDGPYLVHCTEGKDRTGFVCMLIEALCGASYDRIVDDYMITFSNYYKITAQSDRIRYDTIVENLLVPMMETVAASPDIKKADLAAGAERFLLEGGMSAEQISMLKARLCE